jgi:hypothetical protein
LGLRVDERTVSRYLPRGRTSPDRLQRWLVFLRNHRDSLVGMDFFTVPTVTFRLLWVLVVLHHERRRIVHFAVTDQPAAPYGQVNFARDGSALLCRGEDRLVRLWRAPSWAEIDAAEKAQADAIARPPSAK